jgi:acetyltransferase-like isoleucine patch superfamily enzyme
VSARAERWFTMGPRRVAEWRGRLYHRLLPDTFAPGVRIGRGLVLDNPGQLRVGAKAIFHNGCMLLCRPATDDVRPTITIGAKTFFNVNGIVAAGTAVTIGEDVLFGPNVCIVDEDHAFDDPRVAIARQGMRPRGPIVIGDGAWVATGAVVLGGTEIAPRSVVAANAVVRGVFPQRAVLAGAPAKVVRLLD